MDKIKISAVSYLNTKPLLYGLDDPAILERADISLEIPAICAEKLIRKETDIALAPVAVIKQLPEWEIISDHCIGADGEVKTVCIYSMSPLEEVEKIYLDHQSRTSVMLAKILLKEYWQLKPELIDAKPGFEEKVKGKTAAVIIGDRVYKQPVEYKYIYDLGAAWKAHTGLPFVFAAWIAVKKIPQDLISAFDQAQSLGFKALDEIIKKYQPEYVPQFDVRDYFTKYISYDLDERKKEGMQLFLRKMDDIS